MKKKTVKKLLVPRKDFWCASESEHKLREIKLNVSTQEKCRKKYFFPEKLIQFTKTESNIDIEMCVRKLQKMTFNLTRPPFIGWSTRELSP